jgi:hypothetical protein
LEIPASIFRSGILHIRDKAANHVSANASDGGTAQAVVNQLKVDLTQSACRPGMAAICAFETFDLAKRR